MTIALLLSLFLPSASTLRPTFAAPAAVTVTSHCDDPAGPVVVGSFSEGERVTVTATYHSTEPRANSNVEP
jgi:hypothetical protein